MLEIKNLDKFEIYKLKYYCMHFRYDGNLYFIHENNDGYETTIRLYRKKMFKNGKCKSIFIACPNKNLGCIGDLHNYTGINRKTGKYIYSKMDKEYIVRKMTYHGLCKSMFDVSEMDGKIANLREEIGVLQNIISSKQSEIRRLEFNK